MLDFFDERHFWNQKVEWDGKIAYPELKAKLDGHLKWCLIHNFYYEEERGQTCLRCDDEARSKRAKKANVGASVVEGDL